MIRCLGLQKRTILEGALRVDANVSVHKEGEPYGVRTEIKNIGSVRGVASAVTYEINRQIKLKEKGHNIENETRSWNAVTKSTTALRDKEEKQVCVNTCYFSMPMQNCNLFQ